MTEIRQIDKQTDTQTVINECKNRQLGQWSFVIDIINQQVWDAFQGKLYGTVPQHKEKTIMQKYKSKKNDVREGI